jgi:hypothetical protein
MNWLRNWRRRAKVRRDSARSFRPRLESLEGRQVPSTTGIISSILDAHGNPAVFAIAGSDHSLWEYYPAVINPTSTDSTNHWAEVSSGSFVAVSATLDENGAPAAFAIVRGDNSLWEYDAAVFTAATGFWAQVSPGSFATISAAPGNGGPAAEPAVFAVVNGDHSLWEYDTAFAPWTPPRGTGSRSRPAPSRPSARRRSRWARRSPSAS